MATSAVQSDKLIKRMASRKSHSWWWDSHISPKNSKWLAENLEDMDQSVKRMLRLIEEDGDSFAKKAEMYYQKRPELISHVEEFYRMYRSLAERYDHLTGELRRSMSCDNFQGSGMSDFGSEPPSTCPSPSPDLKTSRRKSGGPRALGFDVFLGPGTNDAWQKECDESSTLTDPELESDDESSVNNYSAISTNSSDNQVLNLKIIELEIDLREAREKLGFSKDENGEGLVKGSGLEAHEDVHSKIARYEQELKHLNERKRLSGEVNRLKAELQKFKPLDSSNLQDELNSQLTGEDSNIANAEDGELNNASKPLAEVLSELQLEGLDTDGKISSLVEELRITKERFEESEKRLAPLKEERLACSERIVQLEDQLASAQKEIAAWKRKYETEKKENSKLHERLARLKTSLTDRDHEIRGLTVAVSDAEQKIFPEKAQLKAEMAKLLEERDHLEEQVREWESRGRSFEDDIRNINTEKSTLEATLKEEIDQLYSALISRDDNIENLETALTALESEKEALHARINTLKQELGSRDDKIVELEKHLNDLHVEHAELISGMETARTQFEKMKSKAKELEQEIEKQRVMISEGDEAKREAIRQLCSAIEHYRNSYDSLRLAVSGHRRVTVSAS